MTSTAPRVSLIVTAHNVEPFIGATLDSLIGQSYPNIEIIVVEDGSTDRTADVVERLAIDQPAIRLIRNQCNYGAGLSKGIGIAASNGAYFMLCDGDDMLDREAVTEAMRAAQESGADCVIFGVDNFDHMTGQTICLQLPVNVTGLPHTIDLESSTISTFQLGGLQHILPTFLLRSDLHKKCFAAAFYDAPYFEDVPPYLAVFAHARKIALVNKALYRYRHGRPGQSIESWATKNRGLKAASLRSTFVRALAEPWARNKFVRQIALVKLFYIALHEIRTMRRQGRLAEEQTIWLVRSLMRFFSIPETVAALCRRPRTLAAVMLLRLAPSAVSLIVLRRFLR